MRVSNILLKKYIYLVRTEEATATPRHQPHRATCEVVLTSIQQARRIDACVLLGATDYSYTRRLLAT